MNIGKNLLKKAIFGLLILVMTIGTAPAADTLLDMLPGDALFCVRINDLSGSLAQMDQYLVGVSPMGMAMMVNMQFAQILGDPTLNGVNMTGNFAVVGLSDMTVGLLVPVTNYADFVKNNPNCTQTGEGFSVLSSPNEQAGKFALTEAAGGKYAIVVPENQKNNLTTLKASLTNPPSALVARLSEMQAQQAISVPAWGYVNLADLYEKFSPMVTMKMQEAEDEMSKSMTASGMGEFGQFYIKMYMELFKQFAGEADSATLAITPDPASLSIDVSLRAKDGSNLAQMMVADPTAKQGFTYTGYLDSSNAVNGLMRWNPVSMQKVYDTIFNVMAAANPSDTMSASITQMKDITNKWLPLMGNEMAISFNYAKGQPPFVLQEVIGVKDGAKAQALMTETMGLASDFYAAIGLPLTLKYQSDVATYKNAKLDKITLSFPKSTDPNDMMGQMMSKVYGGGLTYTLAHTDKAFFVTMGEDSEARAKALVDQNPSTPATGDVQAALDLFKGTPFNECAVSINVIKLMQGLGQMMQSMGPVIAEMEGGEAPPPPFEMFSDLNVPTQSSLALGAYSADGQTTSRIVLPKQHLMEIMSMVMQIQQKVMQMQMQQQQSTQQQTP